MKNRVFNTEILRSITHSWGRFIAIFAIVALGVGFYAGLRMTAPDMRLSADQFYDATNLMDIRIVSTMGLNEQDIKVLEGIDGIEEVEAAYETDAVADIDGEPYVVRIHSLPYSTDDKDSAERDSSDGVYGSEEGAVDPESDGISVTEYEMQENMNRLILAEGRWPTADNECILSADRIMNQPLNIGDHLALTECSTGLEDTLEEYEYEVVGLAHSSYYTSSTSMGSSTLGSGLVQQFMFVPQSDFKPDFPITEAFITVDGAKLLNGSSKQYDERIASVMQSIESIAEERQNARFAEIRDDAQSELDDAWQEYLSEKSDALNELDDAAAKLSDAKKKLDSGEREYRDGVEQYNDGLSSYEAEKANAYAQLAEAQAKLDAARATLDASQADLDVKRSELNALKQQYDSNAAMLPSLNDQIASLNSQLSQTSDESQIAQIQGQISYLESQVSAIESAGAQVSAGQAAIDSGQAQIDTSRQQLEAGVSELASKRSDAESQLASAQAELDEAKQKLIDSKKQLDDGRAEYRDGLSEYESSRDEAYDSFASAEDELNDSQSKIDDIDMPEWLVMDRSKNYGAESFDMDAGRVDNIAKVFPFVFFLVAALVALTTMTRMVDEQRMQIGTFKALGYSRARITSKYMIYAGVASLAGSIVGILLLSFTLPAIIMQAYAIIYIVPTGKLEIDLPIALLSIALGVGITLCATAGAALSTLKESPASLMQPKAPKAGKKIFLERIHPLWSRMSFLWKVTCRNIFRYKKRLFMTVIGIAGCTALLLTGFGLQNSINDIIDKHYGELISYNMVVVEQDDIDDSERDAIDDVLKDDPSIDMLADAYEKPMVATGNASDISVELVVPEDPDGFAELWNFRERLSSDSVTLGDSGALITQKLSTRFGLSVGDDIELATQDTMGNATNEHYSIKVAGIIENYIGHDVFMSSKSYEDIFGSEPDYNSIFIRSEAEGADRDRLVSSLRDLQGVKTIAFNDETIDMYKSALRSVNMIVIVLIVAAALLAFIVLYNLTNINISERMREIATLKVLGFTPKEVFQYIFKEILVLSVFGALLGLVLGVFLENFVVTTAEVDAVMFGRDIHMSSYIYAFILTLVFTLIVAVSMHKKLKGIDMVESLKSNE